MDSNRRGSPKKRHAQHLPDPPSKAAASTAGNTSRLDMMSQAFLAPFRNRKADSNKIFSDLAPSIMTSKMINHAATVSTRPKTVMNQTTSATSEFASLGRAPLRFTLRSKRITSRDLQIVEATEELLDAEVPEPDDVATNVSLLRGFNATMPSAEQGRSRRRQTRNIDAPALGLKRLGINARGLLVEEDDHERASVVSEEDVIVVRKPGTSAKNQKSQRKGRTSIGALKTLGKEELKRQTGEILKDKENIQIRRTLVHNEIADITHKIEALDAIRTKLEQDLLKLQEDELELDDELQGVRERMDFENTSRTLVNNAHSRHITQSSRRRKGPAFLPSEHDDLPPGVAFMSLSSHTTPITALDFSEPYGTLVSASQEDTQPRVWDLLSGQETGRLRGHSGSIKCLQVEDHICLTGSEDGTVRLWDLRRVEDDEWQTDAEMVSVRDATHNASEDGEIVGKSNGIRGSTTTVSDEREGPFIRSLEGHSKAVTALYFEDDCLVTGASDKTMRQWDLTTGQCVMTMDILWAISHPPVSGPMSNFFPGIAASTGIFEVATPPYADGTWDMYQDFVGSVQFWEYALVSGSGDGAVRMWDMRTGQTHRTLLGHTAPVTCLQFDEMHIVTGSLDKSLRIWDLRTGGIFDSINYDYAVTGLQFDSRKIVAATGENSIKIYNRTTMQHSSLFTNGHTKPVERLRYIDRYLVSGGRDTMVKIWAL